MAISEATPFSRPKFSTRWLAWMRSLLQHPRAALGLAVLAAVLTLPTIWAGMLGDDFLFVDIFNGVRQPPHPASPFGLFTFSDGDLAHNIQMRAEGLVPWWVDHNARMMFWRPLSEWSHALDHWLWPRSPELAHIHTIGWYALLVYLLARFFRAVDPSIERAHFSALVFAVAPTHLLVLTWLAARNQIIAACFIVLALMAHHRWRRGAGGWGAAAVALACFMAALGAAEAGVAAAGYLVAYALFMDNASWRQRLFSVLPYLLTVLVWRHFYNQLGYGTTGLAGYIDPGRDPLRFLEALVYRLPSLLLAGLTGVTSSTLHGVPLTWRSTYAAGVLAVLGGMFWLTLRTGLWREPVMKFMGVGMLLALVPVSAASPNDRLLLNGEIGLSAILGALLARWALRSRAHWVANGLGWSHRFTQVMAGIHLVLFPVVMVLACMFIGRFSMVICHDEPMSLPNIPAAAGTQVVLLNPPTPLLVGYFPAIRRYHGRESGVSMQALMSADQHVDLTVRDAHTVVMQGSKGFGDDVSRDVLVYPFHVGETIDAGAFVATVERVRSDGYAETVAFRFKRPLRDAQLAFYRWTDHGYVAYVMPDVGGSAKLAPGSLKAMVRHRFTGHW